MTWHAGQGSALQLRADFLREREASEWMGAGLGVGKLADIAAGRSEKIPVKRTQWRQRDLQRALAVAKRSKLERYKVEIAPNGAITIIVGLDERPGRRRG